MQPLDPVINYLCRSEWRIEASYNRVPGRQASLISEEPGLPWPSSTTSFQTAGTTIILP
jgi:hypothetical protein